MKYTYTIDLPMMEKIYFEHTQENFFKTDDEREKFNVKVIVEADSEEEAFQMRTGITDIRMWQLAATE